MWEMGAEACTSVCFSPTSVGTDQHTVGPRLAEFLCESGSSVARIGDLPKLPQDEGLI